MKKFFLIPAFALLTLLSFVGCTDDNDGDDSRIPATEVTLDAVEADLAPGETLQLTAAVAPLNTTDAVIWSSDNTDFVTVSETGLVSAVSVGTATVKALCGEVSAMCVVRVAEKFEIISFEEGEGMVDVNGDPVTLGDAEVVGGFASGTYHNLFWAKPYVDTYGEDVEYMGKTVDMPLFFTADNLVAFGSYYSDGTGWGMGQMDTWGGFTLSQNCNTTATSFNYADQFSVYAESGANAGKTFAVAYCNGMMGGSYANPVIEFVEPREVAYLHLAPSTMLYTYYKYDPSAVSDRTFGYRITGSLKGEVVGYVDVMLVNESKVEAGWVKVDLTALGSVDQLTFAPEGVNPMRDLDPVYFCLDEIALVR